MFDVYCYFTKCVIFLHLIFKLIVGTRRSTNVARFFWLPVLLGPYTKCFSCQMWNISESSVSDKSSLPPQSIYVCRNMFAIG